MTQPVITLFNTKPSKVDYGTDLYCDTDLQPTLSIVSGRFCLAQALFRRAITPRYPLGGGLCYDPNYGTDCRQWVNDSLVDKKDIIRKATLLDREFVKDSRVIRSVTQGVYSPILGGGILTFTTVITDGNGPFPMVIQVSNVTAQLVTPTA